MSESDLDSSHPGVECMLEEGTENIGVHESSLNVTNELYGEERIKFSTLVKLKDRGKMEILKWLMNLGLITSKYTCPKCAKNMVLKERKDSPDGFVWSCYGYGSMKHRTKRSVRTGSIFSESSVALEDILMFIHCWIYKVPNEWMILEMAFSTHTLTEWTFFCRKMCVEICAREDDCQIGGEGVVIEIEGRQFDRWMWDRREVWIFTGIEDVNLEKYFFRIVEKCDKNSFLEVIKSSVLAGTIIVSEFCSAYNCKEDEDFINLAAFFSYKYEDPENYENQKKKSWNAIQKRLPKQRRKEDFETYLAEYAWRKKYADAYDKMRKFMSSIKTIYPTLTKDDDKELSRSDERGGKPGIQLQGPDQGGPRDDLF